MNKQYQGVRVRTMKHNLITFFGIFFCLVYSTKNVCVNEETDTSVNYSSNGDFQIPYLGPGSWRFTTSQLYGWSSTKIQQGTGSIYNSQWGSATQVIQLDTDINQLYNQTLVLPSSKFSFQISYAARGGSPLTTSGIRIWWNGQVIWDLPVSSDYLIHTKTFVVQANQGNNYLILEGRGASDGVGMTADNIIFNKIESSNRIDVGGQCFCNAGYYDDMVNLICQPCSNLDSVCTSCNYTLINSAANNNNYHFQCSSCLQGYFIQNGNCVSFQCQSCGCRASGAVQNAVPSILYSQQECQTRNSLIKLTLAVAIISYIIMFFSLASVKIVGLELFGVLQLAYFNLADNEYVNLYLSPLLNWKFLNGFNINFKNASIVPANVQAIQYSSSFLSNNNLMFLILLLELFISSLMMVLAKKLPALRTINRFFFQQIFITLFLFNSFNIAFSAGLHFKYAEAETTEYYQLSTFAAILGLGLYFFVLIFISTADANGFGQFKKKFKPSFVNQGYIFISVLYRMSLGIYMAISNQETYGTLLILAISLTYIMYNIINLPFAHAYQNYRANLCHVTQLVILMVTNYYRSMRYNDRIQIKAKIHTPAQLQLAMIIICVIVSAACLAYQIYIAIKLRIKQKTVKQPSQQMNQSCQTLPDQKRVANQANKIYD